MVESEELMVEYHWNGGDAGRAFDGINIGNFRQEFGRKE
jgi:hypothetical protein